MPLKIADRTLCQPIEISNYQDLLSTINWADQSFFFWFSGTTIAEMVNCAAKKSALHRDNQNGAHSSGSI